MANVANWQALVTSHLEPLSAFCYGTKFRIYILVALISWASLDFPRIIPFHKLLPGGQSWCRQRRQCLA